MVAAFIVIGVTNAISQTSVAQALIDNRVGPDGNAGQALPAGFGSRQGSLPGVVTGRLNDGPDGGDFPVVTLGRNLLILGTMVLIVQLLRLFGRELKSITAGATQKVAQP